MWDAADGGRNCRAKRFPTWPSESADQPRRPPLRRTVGRRGRVELIPLQPDEEELAYRRVARATERGALLGRLPGAARAAQDEFAACYLELLPPPEQKVPTAAATAEREIAAGRTQDALVHLAARVRGQARGHGTRPEARRPPGVVRAGPGTRRRLRASRRARRGAIRSGEAGARRPGSAACAHTGQTQQEAALALARKAVGNTTRTIPSAG